MRKQSRKAYNQTLVNIAVFALVILLLLYVVYQLFGYGGTTVSTQRTQRITDSEYCYAEAYIFREETLLCREGGVVDYLIGNGEKVQSGQIYGYYYSMPGASDKQIAEAQSEINRLSALIKLLDSSKRASLTVSDLASVNRELSRSYYSYVDLVAKGDYSSADKQGDKLLGALVDYRLVTGGGKAEQSTLADAIEQKQSLISSLGDGEALVADKGCYVYTEADGYEEIFTISSLSSMTADALKQMSDADARESGGAIGKITVDPKWYAAVPLAEAEAVGYNEGQRYSVRFSATGAESSMLLDKIYIGDDGAYLLFSGYDLSLMPEGLRAQEIRIYLSEISGYKIPEEALVRVDGENAVYILVGDRVELRRVTVKSRGNKYYIVSTFEEDAENESVSEIPYLNINDLIITSGNDLYHGKRLS